MYSSARAHLNSVIADGEQDTEFVPPLQSIKGARGGFRKQRTKPREKQQSAVILLRIVVFTDDILV